MHGEGGIQSQIRRTTEKRILLEGSSPVCSSHAPLRASLFAKLEFHIRQFESLGDPKVRACFTTVPIASALF